MSILRYILPAVLLATIGLLHAEAQSLGSLEVSGRVKIDGKQEKLSRKRFYLLKGGFKKIRI